MKFSHAIIEEGMDTISLKMCPQEPFFPIPVAENPHSTKPPSKSNQPNQSTLLLTGCCSRPF